MDFSIARLRYKINDVLKLPSRDKELNQCLNGLQNGLSTP
jgi:hypothetical protein